MSKWTVKVQLTNRGYALQLVKEVKEILGCGLKEAKDIVDNAREESTIVKANIEFGEAQYIRDILIQIPDVTTTIEPYSSQDT